MADNVTALAVQQPHALATQAFFTAEQERMILSTFLGGATKEEATVLLEVVKRRRLDPFSRQVYFVKRWDQQKREEVWAIQTSIDGLRSIAERTGKYDGQDEPEYGEDEAGKFCKVKVYRKDWSPNRAAVGVAYEREFIQKKKDGTVTSFWARMPRLMLAKCAEALAIRKAFPEDTGGLYISEEMSDGAPVETQAPPPPPPAPHAQLAAAAKALDAEIVHQPAPPPELPKPTEAQKALVAARSRLWGKVKAAQGEENAKETPRSQAALKKAAEAVFGPGGKPTTEWTLEDVEKIEHHLFEDVPF